MSNHPRRRGRLNGHRHSPAVTPTAEGPPNVAMTYGMTETGAAAEIEHAKVVTHDQLVDMLGDRRRGPVYWRIVEPDEVPDALRTLDEDPAQSHYEGNEDRAEAFAGMRRWTIEHPEAHLVIAQAAAVT